MAERIEIQFVAKMEQYLSSMLGAQRATEDATKKMTSGFNDLNNSIKSVAGALGVTLGAGALISFAKSAVEGAARLEVLRNNFKGTAADIELFRKATAGTVSEAGLLKLSNQATDLGLTIKQQAILMSLAEDAADKYGGSVEENFQRVIKASEGGTKGLKELGIQKAKYDEIVASYVEGYGVKQLNQLDAETQKWIQVEAMIKAAGVTLDDVLNKVQDSADKIESLGVKWETFKDKSGEVLMPVLGGILDALISIDNWAIQAGNDIDRLLGLKGIFGDNQTQNYSDPKQKADLLQALSNYTWVENGKVVSQTIQPKGTIVKSNKPSVAKKNYNTNIPWYGALSKQYDTGNLPMLDILSAQQMASLVMMQGVNVPGTPDIDTDILRLNESMERFGDTARRATNYLAAGLARALVYGEKLKDVFKNIGAMLLESALSLLINIGLRAGAAALGLPIPFANGGVLSEPVFGMGLRSGRTYTFAEQGVPEVIMPIHKLMNPNYTSSSGPLNINLQINGEFTQRGKDLYAVVNAAQKIIKRYK